VFKIEQFLCSNPNVLSNHHLLVALILIANEDQECRIINWAVGRV